MHTVRAPELRHPAYVVYSMEAEGDLVQTAVAGMRPNRRP